MCKVILRVDSEPVPLTPALIQSLNFDQQALREAIEQTAMMVGLYSVVVKPPDSGFDAESTEMLQRAVDLLAQRGSKPQSQATNLDPLMVKEYASLQMGLKLLMGLSG